MFNFLRRLFGRSMAPQDEQRDDDDIEIVAYVALFDQPVDLPLDALEAAASEAFGADLTDRSNDATDFVTGVPPSYFVQCRGRMLLVNCFQAPYFTPLPPESRMPDDEVLKHIIRSCTAWVSVDIMTGMTHDNAPELRRVMMDLLLRIVDEEACLGFYATHLQLLRPNERRFRQQLRITEDPDDAFRQTDPTIVTAVPNDEELAKASEEARRTWNDFIDAFRAKQPGDENFAVKTAFAEGDEVEHMWVEVERIEGDVIYGRLGNRPENITRYMLGDPVRIDRAEVSDWVFMRHGTMVGGYTSRVFARRGGQGIDL